MTELEFRGAARRIVGDAPYLEAAEALGCELAALRAVAEVESRGAPFLPCGRPTLLFERHVFSRRTGRVHDAAAPEVSNPRPGGYRGGGAEYDRLARAAALDRTRALESASWGAFQIMGFNARACGFAEVGDFAAAIADDEAAQLAALVAFLRANGLDRTLRARDWAGFARGYNGPGYARNRYDERLAAAYARHARAGDGAFRVETVADLQAALEFLGARPGPADGLPGPLTRAAIRRFQRRVRLAETGAPGAALMQAAQAAYYALGGPARRAA